MLNSNGCINPFEDHQLMTGVSRGRLWLYAGLRLLAVREEDPGSTSSYKRLMFIIEHAGLNRFDAGCRGAHKEAQKVRSFAKQITHPGNEQLTLNDVLAIGNECFDFDALSRRVSKCNLMWPSHEVPHIYLMFVASQITRHGDNATEIYWQEDGSKTTRRTFVPCEVSVPAARKDTAKAPYLVFVRAKAGRSNTLDWVDAYAQPIESRESWIPVDSNNEREALAAIKEAIAHQQKRACRCIGYKPVLGFPAKDNLCRPDFLVIDQRNADGLRALVVETMGYDQSEYHERKNRTHALMAQIGVVYQDIRYGKKASTADNRLLDFVSNWFDDETEAAIATSECTQ